MTESNWFLSTEPRVMLEFLGSKASLRKLRLFACACYRRVRYCFPGVGTETALDVGERFADGLIGAEELLSVMYNGTFAEDERASQIIMANLPRYGRLLYALHSGRTEHILDLVEWITGKLRERANDTHAALYAPPTEEIQAARTAWVSAEAASISERAFQADLLRDLFGNPFRLIPVIDAPKLTWAGGIISKMAQSVYEERAFDHLPILADALEEAGCTNPDILSHCRQPGEHVRGCWVVDLILGRS